jgi:hypothetical protein
MVEERVVLTHKQADVLDWIKSGCPVGVYDVGFQHRIIAKTLERRDLVVVSGKGPSWNAIVTPAGKEWQKPLDQKAIDAALVEDLFNRVLAAGGRLTLLEDYKLRSEQARLVQLSLTSPKRPKGKRLKMGTAGSWGSSANEIFFVENVDDQVEPSPVVVPERITHKHVVVKQFESNSDWRFVTKEHLPRASRILQGIADEAPGRGFDLLAGQEALERSDKHRIRDVERCHLALETQSGIYGVQIREVPGVNKRQVNYGTKLTPKWVVRRGWEFESTGKLELIVRGPGLNYDGNRYRDKRNFPVEDQLTGLFRALQIEEVRAKAKAEQERRDALKRKTQWEAAIRQARLRFDSSFRTQHFEANLRTWTNVRERRAFLDEAFEAAQSYEGADREALLQQLEHAKRGIDELDPIRNLALLIPVVPEPAPVDLKPFLDKWSPHEPVKLPRFP